MSPLVFRRCLLASAVVLAAWRLWSSGNADQAGAAPEGAAPTVQIAETLSKAQQR